MLRVLAGFVLVFFAPLVSVAGDIYCASEATNYPLINSNVSKYDGVVYDEAGVPLLQLMGGGGAYIILCRLLRLVFLIIKIIRRH